MIGTRRDRQRLVTRIRALATEPRPAGAQKLSGSDKLRLRQGRYRVVYRVDDAKRTVTIVKIGDRKDVDR